LLEEYQSAPPAPPPSPAPAPAAPQAAASEPEATDPAVDLYELGANALPEKPVSDPAVPNGPVPLAGIVTGLHMSSSRVLDRLGSGAWRDRAWQSAEFEEIRKDLNMIDFYARSIDKIIERNAGDQQRSPRCGLDALGTALSDLASELAHGTGRSLDVRISHEGVEVDPRMMTVADMVLQAMVGDIFRCCDGDAIEVCISVTERYGALHWIVSDDGDNFISDSRLDHEDQLAFYPRLRHVIRILSQHHCVLSVEPSDGRRSRFEFTLPLEAFRESMIAWGEGAQAFTVRSSQLCDLVASDTNARGADARGEYFEFDHQRVPLLRLDVLFPQASEVGDMIAVVGSIEKRVAFYVPDTGQSVDGLLLGDSVPAWQGPVHAVAQVGDKRMPLLEANKILASYLEVTGTLNSDDLSGGVVENDSEPSNGQAESPEGSVPSSETTTPTDTSAGQPSAPDVETPPVNSEPTPATAVEVLVVEQSQSMRDTLTDILTQHKVSAAFAGGVEEAMGMLRSNDPRLIISEFRMPTMAAKKLVDSLRDEGRAIPVLVTTSQSGKTADLLVEKLGVDGYLSKPLSVDEITTCLSNFLGYGVSP